MYYATRGVQIAFRAKLETKRIIIYKLHDEINYFPERKIMCQDLIWPPTFNCKIKFSISLIFHKENTKEINAQSIRKLNKCNFQWTKTLYQRKFLMRARQNKCPISQNDTLHMKLSEYFTWRRCFTILVKFDILFLGLPWEIVFGTCYYS